MSKTWEDMSILRNRLAARASKNWKVTLRTPEFTHLKWLAPDESGRCPATGLYTTTPILFLCPASLLSVPLHTDELGKVIPFIDRTGEGW